MRASQASVLVTVACDGRLVTSRWYGEARTACPTASPFRESPENRRKHVAVLSSVAALSQQHSRASQIDYAFVSITSCLIQQFQLG